ncbi:MAG: type II toxin-antitoxin system RelE/ParE family toxin [Elusimicrobia bacterium]|nr:type II toxin-antitoxin system RelE/ParE family toxin [Elusimicrobiota bacterium]
MLRIQFHPGGDDGPVRERLEALREDPQRNYAWAKLLNDLGFLESEGLLSKRVSIERVQGVPGSVWALRRSFAGIRYRIYFCVREGTAWLLHYLEKKSPRIPPRDLKLIRKRAREVLS